jgi:3-oxoacyl-[acyl-carrier protein] reductase
MSLDVTDSEADMRAVREIHQRFGRIDILVNAAGGMLGAGAGIDEVTLSDWHRVIAANLHAPFYLSLAVAPIMREQRWGRIITVGSGAGRSHSRTRVLPYTASKAGVHGFMRQFAVELAPYGVTCNVVAPGLIMSPLGLEGWAQRSDEEKRETLSSIAANKLGNPMDIANTIAFVASEEASYIVGQTISVDGGHWMF